MIDAADAADLLVMLSEVPDPRATPGRVHPVGYVLAVVLVAFTSPAFEHLAGAAAWAAAAPKWVLRLLGARPDPFTGQVVAPSEATIRRVVTGVDPAAVQSVLTRWLTRRAAAPAPSADDADGGGAGLMGVSVDGKTLRGTRDATGRSDLMRHVLGAATHTGRVMLAQVEVPGKNSEIDYLTTVLDQLTDHDLLTADTVITLDALHTLRESATAIRATNAHYLMTVKANTPTLANAIIDHLAATPPEKITRHSDKSKGHGRTEERHLSAAPLDKVGHLNDTLTFPDAAQVARIVRYRGEPTGQRISKEIIHVITSLPPDTADAATLAAFNRGHWSIEALHHVRDVTFGEDASRVRTGHAPITLAAIRSTITAAIRYAGHTSIAAARRTATLDIHTPLSWFTPRTNPHKPPL